MVTNGVAESVDRARPGEVDAVVDALRNQATDPPQRVTVDRPRGLAMAALTTCAGLAHAPAQAPRSPAASASQAPAWRGCIAPRRTPRRPSRRPAQPRPQTATAAAHSRLPRRVGPARDRCRCRAAGPGRPGDGRCGFGYRTGAVDTIATSSLALSAALSCSPAARPPARRRAPPAARWQGHPTPRVSVLRCTKAALYPPATGRELPNTHMPLRYVNLPRLDRPATA